MPNNKIASTKQAITKIKIADVASPTLARRRGGFVADAVDRHFKAILYASPLRDLALASMTAIRQCFVSLLDLIGDDETS